jgi:hypothetical protein
MIKKDVVFSWGPQEKHDFKIITKSILEEPTMMSLDFEFVFTLYTFSSDTSYVVVLTQKGNEDHEIPISFMSLHLQRSIIKLSSIR